MPPPEPALPHTPELHDYLDDWPYDIPSVLVNPWDTEPLSDYIGLDQVQDSTTFMERLIYTYAILIEAAGAARTLIHFFLRGALNLVDSTRLMVNSDAPSLLSDSPAQTLRTVHRKTGTYVPNIVHPVCPNMLCHEVLYDVTSPVSYSAVGSARLPANLPLNCPACGQVMDGEKGNVPLDFSRIPLRYQLERVLAHPGMEDLAFNWQDRRQLAVRWDEATCPAESILHDQWDGEVLERILGPDGNPLLHDPPRPGDVPVIYLNLYLDWVNRSSSMMSTPYSVGHISLQIVNFPQGLRSVQSMIMPIGIIPGMYLCAHCNLFDLPT